MVWQLDLIFEGPFQVSYSIINLKIFTIWKIASPFFFPEDKRSSDPWVAAEDIGLWRLTNTAADIHQLRIYLRRFRNTSFLSSIQMTLSLLSLYKVMVSERRNSSSNAYSTATVRKRGHTTHHRERWGKRSEEWPCSTQGRAAGGRRGCRHWTEISLWGERGGAGEKCGKEGAAEEQLGTVRNWPRSPFPNSWRTCSDEIWRVGNGIGVFIVVAQHPTLLLTGNKFIFPKESLLCPWQWLIKWSVCLYFDYKLCHFI